MPSNIDKAFIENLQNFTESLEGIVDLMKQQAEKGDAVNQMLSSMDGPKMSQISEDIKTLITKTDKVDSRTKEILEEVKASRKAKESGMFGKISDPENKDKILDGIKVITLIAGGVLAIGMAFKIIGDVDLLSVLTLGVAIYASAKAFEAVANIKGLTLKKMGVVALSIVIMSGAILASGMILKNMPSIDIFAAFSIIVVSGALGIAAFLLLKAVGKMNLKPKDLVCVMLLPLILPAISLGIVLSSLIIKNMSPIDLKTGISFALLGGTLGFAAMLLLKGVGKIDLKKNMVNILLLPLILPLISLSIVLSSLILKGFQPISEPLALITGAGAIGVSIVMFLPVFWAIDKFKIDPVRALMGGLIIIIAATAIMLSSWILSVGKYDKFPSFKWAAGVGLAIITFSPALVVLGAIAMSGIGALAILAGAGMVAIVASTIVAVSHILTNGTYKDGPPLSWAIGTALLISSFGASMLILGLVPFGGKILDKGAERMDKIAWAIRNSSYILGGGKYVGGPTKEWAEGVALSIGAFSKALVISMEGGGFGLFSKSDFGPDDFPNFIKSVAWGMIAAADVLSNGKWVSGPSKEWGEGVAASLEPFIALFENITNSSQARKIIKDLKKSKDNNKDSIFTYLIKDVAYAMVSVDDILSKGKWVSGPPKEWGEGVSDAVDIMIKITDKGENFNTMSMLGFKLALATLASVDMSDVVKIMNLMELLGSVDKSNLMNVQFMLQSLTVSKSQIDGIKNFSNAVRELSRSFNSLKRSGIDKLNKFTGSVTILSAVDKDQLSSIIGVLNDNKEKLGDVTKEANKGIDGGSFGSGVKQKQEKVQPFSGAKKTNDLSPGEKVLSDKFDTVIEKFDEILEIMVKDGQGEDAGKKDSLRGR